MVARRWLALLSGLALLALFVLGLHQFTARLGGSTGEMISRNRSQDLEVYAYVYSEVGDLGEFLDDENGKYGKRALARPQDP